MKLQLDDAGKIKNSHIAEELCLPPVKLHCSSKFSKKKVISRIFIKIKLLLIVLAEDAIKAALKDYKLKNEEKVTAP